MDIPDLSGIISAIPAQTGEISVILIVAVAMAVVLFAKHVFEFLKGFLMISAAMLLGYALLKLVFRVI